jgi:hypothetical protein
MRKIITIILVLFAFSCEKETPYEGWVFYNNTDLKLKLLIFCTPKVDTLLTAHSVFKMSYDDYHVNDGELFYVSELDNQLFMAAKVKNKNYIE